jgi:Rod binding domain-containing protein
VKSETRSFDLQAMSPADVSSRLILDADIDGSEEIAKYSRDVLSVFVHRLAKRRRRVTIDQIRDIMDQPPNEIYRELTDALRVVPRQLNSKVLATVRSAVRRACSDGRLSATLGPGSASLRRERS